MQPPQPTRKSRSKNRKSLAAWLFVGPALVHLLVFALIPIGFAFYISLFKLQLIQNKSSSKTGTGILELFV